MVQLVGAFFTLELEIDRTLEVVSSVPQKLLEKDKNFIVTNIF